VQGRAPRIEVRDANGDSESFPYQPKLSHWYEASYYRTKGGVLVEKFDH